MKRLLMAVVMSYQTILISFLAKILCTLMPIKNLVLIEIMLNNHIYNHFDELLVYSSSL